MTQNNFSEDHNFLASLALAMVEKPRANLQELAQCIGISKATLYRFCRTREELQNRLINYSVVVIMEAFQRVNLKTEEPRTALKQLVYSLLILKEFVAFLAYYCQSKHSNNEESNEHLYQVLDNFFLQGQQSGVFRIDITAAALSELWINILTSFIDAERRGRVARVGLDLLIETVFFDGVGAKYPLGE